MSKNYSGASIEKATAVLADFSRAVSRLGAALEQPESEFIRDAAIQRFEFSFELAWKSIQILAKIEAMDSGTPRMAFSTAWRNGWVSEEEIWLDMLDQRNKTSHTYHEATAEDVFTSLPRFMPHLNSLHRALTNRLRQIQKQQDESATD